MLERESKCDGALSKRECCVESASKEAPKQCPQVSAHEQPAKITSEVKRAPSDPHSEGMLERESK